MIPPTIPPNSETLSKPPTSSDPGTLHPSTHGTHNERPQHLLQRSAFLHVFFSLSFISFALLLISQFPSPFLFYTGETTGHFPTNPRFRTSASRLRNPPEPENKGTEINTRMA